MKTEEDLLIVFSAQVLLSRNEQVQAAECLLVNSVAEDLVTFLREPRKD